MTYLQDIWSKMYMIGVGGTGSVEQKMILLLNQAAFMTLFGALIMSFISYKFNLEPAYIIYSSTLAVLYLVIPILHYFKKNAWVQVYIIFVLSNWIYIIIILSGMFFSQGMASMVTIILGYFFFQKNRKMQIMAIAYNFAMFSLATTYAFYFPKLIPITEVPFDEVGVYLISFSWIYVIFPVYELERENLILSLKNKNEDLEKTTAELERFTHIASHDLKSPVRTIISFLGLIERDIKRSNYEGLASNLEYAKSGARQLSYLIEDVLELSKVGTSGNNEKATVKLATVFEKVMLNLNAELIEKNVSISTGQLPILQCNETEFILVFQNLIQNGIKYNKSKKPKIRIWSERLHDDFFIHFQDNGIGIEAQYFDKVFEHFKRLHTSNEYSGTGLGLSLCKKIIENYAGSIKVKSVVGEGSTFTLCLPVGLTVEPEEAEVAQNQFG